MVQAIIHEATMRKPLTTLAVMSLVLACGPEAGEDEIPGKLEYEQIHDRVYRLDRRIDVIKELPGEDGERRECGFLTDRVYDDLEDTLAALDPGVDYGEHGPDCNTHGALVYVDGFEYSPFECTHECCHQDLIWAAFVYTVVLTNFANIHPTIDGEPYVAIEPDQPCP